MQVNKQAVALPYKKYGLQVYESGINYVVNIPELDALISYNGLSFAIQLPYRLFGNNTKGQCGELPTGSGPCPVEGGGQTGCECPPAQRGSPASLLGDLWAQGLGDPRLLGAAGTLPMRRPGFGACGTLTGVRCCLAPGRPAGHRVQRGSLAAAGTCTNNTADDCVLPSGEVVSDCEVAADQWVVNDPSKPHCPHTSFTTRRPATTPPGGSTGPSRNCSSPLCELIKDRCGLPAAGSRGAGSSVSPPALPPTPHQQGEEAGAEGAGHRGAPDSGSCFLWAELPGQTSLCLF